MTGLKLSEGTLRLYPPHFLHSKSFDIYTTLFQTLGKLQLILCLIYHHAFKKHGGVELIYSHAWSRHEMKISVHLREYALYRLEGGMLTHVPTAQEPGRITRPVWTL
jgi:hypothetical protein